MTRLKRTPAIKLLVWIVLIVVYSCSSNEHLLFENVPVDGPLNDFVALLAQSGFTPVAKINENQVKLRGKFLDKNCEIFVYGSEKTKTVYKVIANLPEETRDSMKYSYIKLQDYCESKHGPGTQRFQQFHNSSRFIFNEPKITRQMNVGDYTRYVTGQGTKYLVVRSGYFSIVFIDRQNNELRIKEKASDNNNDESDQGLY